MAAHSKPHGVARRKARIKETAAPSFLCFASNFDLCQVCFDLRGDSAEHEESVTVLRHWYAVLRVARRKAVLYYVNYNSERNRSILARQPGTGSTRL